MAKFYAKIGFIQTVETSPGIFDPVVTERAYRGDLLRDVQRQNPGEFTPYSEIKLDNRFSIIADKYILENFTYLGYILWNGVYWGIGSIEEKPPRLIFSIRGVYNGKTAN